MQFLYQYPDVRGPEGDLLEAGPVGEVALAVEAAGWSGFSFTEHPAPSAKWLEHGGHQTLDPFVALAHASAVTSRIRLLTYLAVVPYRNPLMLAKAAATLDRVSNGRFTLGVGTGYLKSEFFAVGADFATRNARFDEALDVLPLAWSGEPFSYTGSDFEAREVVCRPASVQQPIPIWIGGNAQLTMRRVAARAQGWMPMTTTPEVAATARTPHVGLDDLGERIARVRADAGDRGAAIDVMVAYDGLDANDPSTEAERHRDAFGRLADLGVTWIAVHGETASTAATLSWINGFGDTHVKDGR
jgi:probable F420-dependent oxidoreductase